jgi:hypothetical protein
MEVFMNRTLFFITFLVVFLFASLTAVPAYANGADTTKDVFRSVDEQTAECYYAQWDITIRHNQVSTPSGKYHSTYHASVWLRVENTCTGELQEFQDYQSLYAEKYQDGEMQMYISRTRRKLDGEGFSGPIDARHVYTFANGKLVNLFMWINGEKINLMDE